MKTVLAALAISTLALSASAATGTAVIAGTAAGSAVAGTVTLQDTPKGLKVSASLTGVPAGTHAFHIHEFGSCADAAMAAGGHYNPKKSHHGFLPKDGLKKAHAGDLGNVVADASGAATLEIVLPGITLSGGKYPVAGRAFVLHEKADDFGQPVGNAGSRIGCGAIVLTAK